MYMTRVVHGFQIFPLNILSEIGREQPYILPYL